MSLDTEKFIAGLHEYLGSQINPVLSRLKALESEVAVLSQKKYMGVYQQALDYKKGNSCTHGGSLWICCRDTTEKPGSCSDWQLASKKDL